VDAPVDEGVGHLRIGWGPGVADGETADAVDCVLDNGGVTSVDDHSEPMGGKQFGDGEPDASRAADDHGSGQLTSF
jgi:hypothetical protein